ncbi:MAG TPA: regulatory iron-sulfur-containing complex subunit RicT [Candidatus Tectomicrobia bacterium]|nr:regulatory iron-sulfur-containing complex subunit RicT [Candidatus Tectomicrobia bacterium]
MSELLNEIASDHAMSASDSQVYVVGVRLSSRLASKSSSYRVEGKWLRFGDVCLVEHGDDCALGKVWLPPRLPAHERSIPKPRVIRKASEADLASEGRREALEQEAHAYAASAIRGHALPMKLGKVEFTFDGRKATFFFTAEGRIDFRELVRELAHRFHIRVEMRQVGVRDEAGLLGGAGVCGRELCCSTWLKDLKPVSIKAAKQQGLMLNPSKLSGVCGRLRCCLNYELPGYGGGNGGCNGGNGGCSGGNCRKG